MLILRRLLVSHLNLNKIITANYKMEAGISRRKKVLRDSANEMEKDAEDFEDAESDFMNVQQSHKQFLQETEIRKEKEKYLIVRQKYFKQKFPNFLMYNEKEQIKYLFNKDSKEWDIQTLSDAFPATPDIILKILKSKWSIKDRKKVLHHDETVLKNWTDFKQGKLNDLLPEDLNQHLKKFTQRNLPRGQAQIADDNKIIVEPDNSKFKGDFSEIISSYQRIQSQKQEQEEIVVLESDNANKKEKKINFKLKEKEKPKKNYLTLKELQENIKVKAEHGEEISLQEKFIKDTNLPERNEIKLIDKQVPKNELSQYQNDTNKIGFLKKDQKDLSHLIYPESITIPKKLYKKGFTYKLNDCYYDSDGAFLYRVPGMY